MTRTGQYCCVVVALVLCLALVVFSIGGATTTARADARTGEDHRLPLRLEDIEAALAPLLPAAQQYALTGTVSDRRRFEHLLSRLGETSVAVDRGVAAPEGSERLQLLDAVHRMLPRLRELGREILAVPDVRAPGVVTPQVSALVQLGERILTALGQLRTAPAPREAETKRTTVGPRAPAAVVPEGVAVLLVTIVGAVSMALVSATRHLDLARRR